MYDWSASGEGWMGGTIDYAEVSQSSCSGPRMDAHLKPLRGEIVPNDRCEYDRSFWELPINHGRHPRRAQDEKRHIILELPKQPSQASYEPRWAILRGVDGV